LFGSAAAQNNVLNDIVDSLTGIAGQLGLIEDTEATIGELEQFMTDLATGFASAIDGLLGLVEYDDYGAKLDILGILIANVWASPAATELVAQRIIDFVTAHPGYLLGRYSVSATIGALVSLGTRCVFCGMGATLAVTGGTILGTAFNHIDTAQSYGVTPENADLVTDVIISGAVLGNSIDTELQEIFGGY